MFRSHLTLNPEKGKYYDVLFDCPIIFINTAVYRAWHKRLFKIFGTGAATILFEMGRELGEDAVQRMKKKIGNPMKLFSLGIEHGFYLGWGKFKVSKTQLLKAAMTKSLMVKIENGFIPKAVGNKGEASCHFFRGILVGACNAFMGEEYACEETKCMSKGDLHCEFHLKKSK